MCSVVREDKNPFWNFTACVSVVQFRVLWVKGTFLRPWFCFIALATRCNATQIPLTVWVRTFSQCESACVSVHAQVSVRVPVPEMEPQPCFLRNGLVGGHIASEGKPYCITALASGLRSLPPVTLTGAWTPRGLWLLYHNVQLGQKTLIIIIVFIIILLLFVMIRIVAAAYLWVKTCSMLCVTCI